MNEDFLGGHAPDRINLHAGPLLMVFEPSNAFLRYIRLGDTEILRGLYAAVRDHNWDTITPEVSNVQLASTKDDFTLTFDVEVVKPPIDFYWKGTITGTASGSVRFLFEGEARSSFRRNRIGFCVLHPHTCAGLPCRVEHTDGTVIESTFPDFISPHQPFMDIRAITHEVIPGVTAEVWFEGDVFEMEDQRNWTDASYKTYCTPLGLPFPVEIPTGTRIRQQISLTLHGAVPTPKTVDSTETVTLKVGIPTGVKLPEIGLGTASDGLPLSAFEIERLRALHPAHLRFDLEFRNTNWKAHLKQAAEEALALESKLELALFFSNEIEAELSELAAALETVRPPLARWLVFHVNEKSTRAHWIQTARPVLHTYNPVIPIVAGSNAYFTELNRERPPLAELDGICYSINPQVHAFDTASLVETLELQGMTVQSARHFAPDHPISISPVTLKPRFNPNATGADVESVPGELPDTVDARQPTLFAAGWTLGSLKYLSAQAVHSITYFQTVGWRGVMQRINESDMFGSIPGAVFPVYHVLADMAAYIDGTVLPVTTNAPLQADGMAITRGNEARLMLANLTAQVSSVRVVLPSGWSNLRVRTLDASNVMEAMLDPQAFGSYPGERILSHMLELQPYAYLCINADCIEEVANE